MYLDWLRTLLFRNSRVAARKSVLAALFKLFQASMSTMTRSKSGFVLALPIVTALLAPLAYPSVVRGSELGTGISRLFDLGTKNTPPALAATKSQYEQLKRGNPKDRRIDYAYGVVLLNQHKYRDALPLLSRYLETGGADLNAYRAKIWAQLQDRKYADALDEMVALGKRLHRDPNAQIETSCAETARFIGAVFAYLELARPGTVETASASKRRTAVLAQLSDRYSPAFDEGRNQVAARLGELQRTQKAAKEKLAAVIEDRQQLEKTALAEDRGKIAVQQEAMQSNAEQLREAERELIVINNQLASLRGDRTRVGAQIVTIQTQLLEMQQQAITANRPVADIGLQAQARGLSLSMAGLNKQAFDMDRRILALQNRAAALMGKGQQEAQTLAQRDAVVQKAAKHAKAVEKKLAREEAAPPKASTAVLTSQMTSLSTYLPFPYEQEKKRVLGWFEKK